MSLADRINTMLPLHPFVGAGSHEGRSIHTTAAEVCGASRLLEARIYHRYPRERPCLRTNNTNLPPVPPANVPVSDPTGGTGSRLLV
jgi:hypothetical protein